MTDKASNYSKTPTLPPVSFERCPDCGEPLGLTQTADPRLLAAVICDPCAAKRRARGVVAPNPSRAKRLRALEGYFRGEWKAIRAVASSQGERERRMAGVVARALGQDDIPHRRMLIELYSTMGFRATNRAAMGVIASGVPHGKRFKALVSRLETAQVDTGRVAS